MRKIMNKLQDELKREPTNEEVAQLMGISVNRVAHFKSVSVPTSSLDAPVNSDSDDSSELGDFISDEAVNNPFEDLHSKTLNSDVNSLIKKLSGREADIIRMRFGLSGEERPKTLEEVGDFYKITRERVRQLQNSALLKMRNAMSKQEEIKTAEELHEEKLSQERKKVISQYMAEVKVLADNK
jgi:RNA polymerase primary sigma factor